MIAEILRDAEKRKRYDHFYENGVPRWRGTGYYYSRYRPGLGAVVAGLTVFSIFIHYVFLYLSFRLSKMRIAAFRTQALEAAWGPTKKPQQGKKKLKVKTSDQGDPLGMPGVNNGKPTPPGSTIEMVVEGENVFIVENRKGASAWPARLFGACHWACSRLPPVCLAWCELTLASPQRTF